MVLLLVRTHDETVIVNRSKLVDNEVVTNLMVIDDKHP